MGPHALLRLGLIFILLGAVSFGFAQFAGRDEWMLHGIWCIAGLAVLLPRLISCVWNAGMEPLLNNHFLMFSAAFSAYFLFGAALLAFGPADQIAFSLAYYPITAVDALYVNAINGIGFGIALLAGAMSSTRWMTRQATRLARMAAKFPVDLTILALMLVGTAASFYVTSIDYAQPDRVIAGLWRTAEKLQLAAILIAAAHRGKHEHSLRFLAVSLTLLESLSGLLLLSKSAVLLPPAALTAGLALRYGARSVLPIGTLFMGVIFVGIAGPVAYARNILGFRGGQSIEVRWQVIKDGFLAKRVENPSAAYSPWSRFCYTPSQAASLHFFDAGIGGDALRLIPWVIVPRALVPEKPVITQVNIDFHFKITGRRDSANSMGIFAGGYYEIGWPGVLLISAACGWILAQTSAIATAVMRQRALLMLPFALLGVHIAFRIDGHFLTDYFGAFAFLLMPLLAASFLLSSHVHRSRRH